MPRSPATQRRAAAHLLPGSGQSRRLSSSGGNYLLTLTGAPTPTSYPYTGGTSVWPYTYASQQRPVDAEPEQLAAAAASIEGTAIVNATAAIYVLDNEPITISLRYGDMCLSRRHVSRARFCPSPWASGGALAG